MIHFGADGSDLTGAVTQTKRRGKIKGNRPGGAAGGAAASAQFWEGAVQFWGGPGYGGGGAM